MSLAIDTDDVKEVMIGDVWYKVEGKSFCIDSYEFLDGKGRDAMVVHGGGQCGITAAGFSFMTENEITISGPLTAIMAVKH